MAETVDILGRIIVRSTSDERPWTASVSNKVVDESSVKKVLLSGTTPVEIDLYSFGDDTGPKGIYVENDYRVTVKFGSSSATNLGIPLRGPGLFVGLVTGSNTSNLWLVNPSSTDTAEVTVGVFNLSTA